MPKPVEKKPGKRAAAPKASAAAAAGTATGKTGKPAAKATGKTASEPGPARIVQKKDFVDRVVAASGVSKAQARPVIEATLRALGEAFAAGETLAVPPFGKARVNRQKDITGGEVITLRLRRKLGPQQSD